MILRFIERTKDAISLISSIDSAGRQLYPLGTLDQYHFGSSADDILEFPACPICHHRLVGPLVMDAAGQEAPGEIAFHANHLLQGIIGAPVTDTNSSPRPKRAARQVAMAWSAGYQLRPPRASSAPKI